MSLDQVEFAADILGCYRPVVDVTRFSAFWGKELVVIFKGFDFE